MTTYVKTGAPSGATIARLAHKAVAQSVIRNQYREREDKIRRFALGARSDWR